MEDNLKDIDNITECLMEKCIEKILEDNYREIDLVHSDIRYAYYGDSNEFYSYIDNRLHTLPAKPYTHKLSDCTYEYLEEEIKKMIYPYVEYLKTINKLPPMHLMSIVLQPIDYKPDAEQELCIYFNRCKIKNDLIDLYIGIGTC